MRGIFTFSVNFGSIRRRTLARETVLKWLPQPTLLALLVAGCVTTAHVPPEIARRIPNDAVAIKLYSNESPADYYRTIYRGLVSDGFGISQENQEMHTLATDFKEIGQGTTLKISVFVDDWEGGSVATIRGKWGVTASFGAGVSAATGANLGGTSAEEATWGSSGRPKAAFGEMAVIATKLPHERLEYVGPQ